MTGLIQLVIQIAVSMLFLAAAIVVHSDLKNRTDPSGIDDEQELSPA